MKGTPFDFFVQFHVTERCNLSCRHCYQSAPTAEMTTGEIISAIDNVSDAITGWAVEYDMVLQPSFHFTGGEPFLRKDLFEILAYAYKQDFSISLMSNGTMIDGAITKRLKDVHIADVQISLDGLEPTHDSLRGKGSYKRALEGIKNLISQGVQTHINLTVSRMNMGQTEELIRIAEGLGVYAIAFSRLVPAGRGKKLIDQALTREETAAFYRKLREYGDKSRIMVTSRDPLAAIAGLDSYEEIPETDIPIGGCAAGIFGITICADGTIMPCRRMDLAIGNIKGVSFRELWAESPVLWSLRTQKDYHGDCRECRYWSVCRGCRAIALAYARANGTEDYLGPDPQCFYQQVLK